MYRHKRKPIQGEAVQFLANGDNDETIAAWLRVPEAQIKGANAAIMRRAGSIERLERGGDKTPKGGAEKITVGDWLIRQPDGVCIVSKEHDFEEAYEAITESAPKKAKKRAD